LDISSLQWHLRAKVFTAKFWMRAEVVVSFISAIAASYEILE
jgi:hypothetical protein